MSEPTTSPIPPHVQETGPLEQVVEAQAKGIIASSESHGAETPGHVSAAADACRETAIFLLVLWAILSHLGIGYAQTATIFGIVTFGWATWKLGRSSWLGWTRLERLHRMMTEERWEIENHRQQERDELKVLYQAKGFHGKLLEDVVDVLMADGDRLLRVMIEEELGLSLEVHEHPLKQGLGAGVGALGAGTLCTALAWLIPTYGIVVSAMSVIGIAAGLSAYLERNRVIPAVIWNLGIASLAFCGTYFLLDWFRVAG